MNQDIINLVNHVIKEELAINGDNKIVTEELYNNEQLSGLSLKTIYKIARDLSNVIGFELI